MTSVPYLFLPAALREEGLGLNVLLESWGMRDYSRDRFGCCQSGSEALTRIDRLISALSEGREQLASELADWTP